MLEVASSAGSFPDSSAGDNRTLGESKLHDWQESTETLPACGSVRPVGLHGALTRTGTLSGNGDPSEGATDISGGLIWRVQ